MNMQLKANVTSSPAFAAAEASSALEPGRLFFIYDNFGNWEAKKGAWHGCLAPFLFQFAYEL